MSLKYVTSLCVAFMLFMAFPSMAINMPAEKEAVSITELQEEIDAKLNNTTLDKKERKKLEKAKKKLAKFSKKVAKQKEQFKRGSFSSDKFTLGIILIAGAIALGLIGLIISIGGLIPFIAGLLALGGVIFIIWGLVENM